MSDMAILFEQNFREPVHSIVQAKTVVIWPRSFTNLIKDQLDAIAAKKQNFLATGDLYGIRYSSSDSGEKIEMHWVSKSAAQEWIDFLSGYGPLDAQLIDADQI